MHPVVWFGPFVVRLLTICLITELVKAMLSVPTVVRLVGDSRCRLLVLGDDFGFVVVRLLSV